ncbi:unnamed protein product [Closterium sp. NIES-54]
MVTITTPGGQRASICMCKWTGRHLATFTCRPGSSLYRLATEPPLVAVSAQVSASGPVAPPFSSMPPLPPSPAPPCLPYVEGRQRAAPHSSFPPTSAPLQTLHMDVWGPARVSGQGRERYFLLVVDDYTRYTSVFPLRCKSKVPDVLIPWIRAVRLQLRERFRRDLPVLRLHSDRGGEFTSDLLRDFYRGEGILELFTLPACPQQYGIAERRIGLVMEVARTSMIHVAASHFLWPFAVRYAAHQLNIWPRVSLPETLPTLRWTGKVGDALLIRVCCSRAFVRDTSADKLSASAIPYVFLGFPHDAPGWQFYHPTSRRVFPSQDLTFDESVPFYCLFPYCSAPLPPPPFFLAPGPPPVDPLPPQGPAPSGVSQVDPLPGTVPVEVAVDSVCEAFWRPDESHSSASYVTPPTDIAADAHQSATSIIPSPFRSSSALWFLDDFVPLFHARTAGAEGPGGAGAAGSGDTGRPGPYFVPLLQQWHDKLKTTLAALGFAPSTADPSLFLHTDTWLLPFYVLVYVDELVFASADTEALAHVKSELQKRYTCTDLGELRSYLGLQITRDRAWRTITLT